MMIRFPECLPWLTLIFLLAMNCTGPEDTPSTWDSTNHLVPLLRAARDPHQPFPSISLGMEADGATTDVYLSFLRAEAELKRGDVEEARRLYREVITWAQGNPYDDDYGGSGLAVVALWRWICLLEGSVSGDSRFAEEAFDKLEHTRFAERMTEFPILLSLPAIREDLERRLAHSAWRNGQQETALRHFLGYISHTSAPVLAPAEQSLSDSLVSLRLASRERLELLRGIRLFRLGMYDAASRVLRGVSEGTDPEAQAESRLFLVKVDKIRGVPREQLLEFLNDIEVASDPNVAQQILYERAMLELSMGRIIEFRQDMGKLIREFPNGRWADDAYYQLASHYQDIGQVDRSLLYYRALRELPGPNDWVNSSYYFPALALYGRKGPNDLKTADSLLSFLIDLYPHGPLRLNATFWKARIAEDLGQRESARILYSAVSDSGPFEYYGIRARMHINDPVATSSLWPDDSTSAWIKSQYQAGSVDTIIEGESPYHERTRIALRSRLYHEVLTGEARARRQFKGQRLEQLSLEELDDAGLLTDLVVLLALRQDILAAGDQPISPENSLKLAGAVGHVAGDYQLVLTIVRVTDGGENTLEERRSLQNDARFLPTAFPSVYAEELIEAAELANTVPPELLYSIIRQESLFHPAALSADGALGLFQFIPTTFKDLNERWSLLANSGITDSTEYLMDPQRSIALGGKWFSDRLLPSFQGNLLLSIMAHNAGPGNVRIWQRDWERNGQSTDYEYVIETIRIQQTRLFVREIITDTTISDAIELFDSRPLSAMTRPAVSR